LRPQFEPASGGSRTNLDSVAPTATNNAEPDRRTGDRRRVLKGAMIVFNGGHCTLGCQILDVSDTGALVMPADIFLCPAEFVLKPRVGSPRDCEVVWRKNDKVGVRYI
jgi:hypothetical protein